MPRMNEHPSNSARGGAVPADTTIRPPASLRSRAMLVVIAAAVLTRFALSVMQAYALGHHARMYDNPVYRWREALVIALSRMQPQPLHGYLGYRSIGKYFAEHGLALVAGEAATV